ncbi:DUF1206 domain-containing protein [Nocardioides sp. zg-536]|uniref:DUF1206 domain-containing protein n=1 Tax=Nocardioides faecalis TaxID=2803858 RepID=A0A939BX69_9ACTN|nr:DUF1206 domain-containing protein [Nocardioides faecalis]MBM9459058.1 DUF1206 domain-containing protein [Nocardioides faecalis]QVI57322.1 DUF1206 domain-containing protein [Nocardioides faecalis]
MSVTKSRTQDRAQQRARQMRDNTALDRLARAGMAGYGLVYVLIAWLAAQLALGRASGSASGEGAFAELSGSPLGKVSLWVVAIGLAGLCLRQAFQAVGGHGDHDGARRWVARVSSAVRGVVFATLAVLAVRTALGDGGSGGGSGEAGLSQRLLELPFGPVLVVGVGLVLIGVGIASAWRGLNDKWRKDLEVDGQTGHIGTVVTVLARVGYTGRAVAFALIAWLFVLAGLTHDPKKSGGLDQAVVRFRDEPWGPWVLVAVAVGLGCYGAFHVARGWYLRNR